ncbi:MAG TPA: hypothetical protein VLD58_07635, partial [Gemmatimonadales bacterium]|nr:hypothetical protein [Gemmatimonadales bacterium]
AGRPAMMQATPQPEIPTPPPAPPEPPDHVIVQVPPSFPTPPPWVTLPPQVTLLIVLGFFAACAVVLFPLMRAIARRIEGRHTGVDGAGRAELEQLRNRVSDLEALPVRVLELEERVDFAERLLAQRREPERLDRGSS